MGCRVLFLGILAMAVAGCGGDESTGEKQYQIAVIPKGTSHEFWRSVHAGAQNAAEELGNVKILWKGPLQEDNTKGQIDVLQDFTVKQVDGICLAPLDSQALIQPIAVAVEEGIPVVIFDSGIDDESNIVSYVATDNRQGGVIAARRMAESLDGKGNVILLRYNPGSESTEQREKGFLDALKEEFPEINVISSDEYAGVTPEEAYSKANQVLGKFTGEVDGVFAVCEPNGSGVLNAIEELEIAGKIKFVTFDPNKPLIDAMQSGTVHGIVLQDPVKMGYEAVMTMVKHLQGEKIEKRINTGEYVATPENMKTPEMEKLLKPEQYED